MDDDALAQPTPCVRCSGLCGLSVVGRCPDCIADIGLRHPDEHAAFKRDVAREFGAK